MKILITGINGFVGSNFTEKWKEHHILYGLDINQAQPEGMVVKRKPLKASGLQGLFYDFWPILLCFWKVDTLLLLGVQGMPILPFLKLFRKVDIVAKVGEVE